MAAQTKPEPESAAPPTSRMQLTASERETIGVGKYPAHIQAAIEARRMLSRVAAEVAALSWGREMDQTSRVALARWGQEYGIDITTEIDILGGKPYLNARFYLNRAVELQREGVLEYLVPDHIHVDKRLEALARGEGETAERARRELDRRAMERIAFNAPDEAKAIVVARAGVRAPSGALVEFTGCKWTGGGTKKSDPIGEAAPVETAETRAYRRVLRLLVSHVPKAQRWIDAASDAGEVLAGEIREARGASKLREAEIVRSLPAAAGRVEGAVPTDPYDDLPAAATPDAESVRLEDVAPGELALDVKPARGRNAVAEGR